MKRHIPNSITAANLICGCIAIGAAFQQDFTLALMFIVLGAIFDFFDGFAARLLHVSGPIGKELDSLADVVTFGVAPATMVVQMLSITAPACTPEGRPLMANLPYAGFLIAAFSALRLAKFNLDTRQSDSFIGLPTPANALFWGAIAVTFFTEGNRVNDSVIPFVSLLALTAVSCWILVSEIPMFALKFKSFGWKGNEIRYSFMAFALLLIITPIPFGFPALGIAGTIVFYILVSILVNKFGKKH